uniref:small monomeric GTPase n=1 Tax=Clastoptera arizonana TaxID=38151 RepID=A0A1B6C631_9HEMI
MSSFNSQNNSSRLGIKKILLKVVILGDGGVGKSCLMNRFVNNQFDSHSCHTVGVEFFNKDIEIFGESYTLQIWDTAGQERFKSLRTPFYRGTDVCMLTYAINDRQSFANLTTWKDEFIYYADIKNPEQYPFLVIGNKLDIPDDKREVETSDAKCWSKENGAFPFIETSAKDATNEKRLNLK